LTRPLDIRQRILTIADRCVLCGMCLPHCPTYRLAQEETESPRGRISLAQALAADRLPASAGLANHLDHCLGCRACEAVCPSKVAYGTLLRDSRELLAQQRPPGLPARLARQALTTKGGGRLLTAAVALQRHLHPIKAGSTGLVARAAARLPAAAPSTALPRQLPAIGPQRGRVTLFVGCTGRLFDRQTLAAALQLLPLAGLELIIPPGQGCCGALHTHAGEGERARQLAATNLQAFADPGDAIVAITSGCAATLSDYEEMTGQALSAPVRELSDLLAEQLPKEGLPLAPLSKRIAIHEPCSQTRVLRRPGSARRLLERIPGIELFELASNELCCGASGSHMLTQPAIADALAQPKLAELHERGGELLVTTNIGCLLHLKANLGEASGVELLHPAALLARQLRP